MARQTLYVQAINGAKREYGINKVAPALFARNAGHKDERVAEICGIPPEHAADFAMALDRFVACCQRGQIENTPYDGWVVKDPLIVSPDYRYLP